MSTIIASAIPAGITQDRVEKFFSFCGDIKSTKLVSSSPTQSYQIVFSSSKALETALLLNEAELDGTPIKVTAADEDKPPQYSETSAAAIAAASGDHKVQSQTQQTPAHHGEDDIQQEEKPKYVIVTQLLANGYTLSDHIINKSIEYDKKQGYSSHFKNFLTGLDEKYIHSKEPESDFNKNLGKAQEKLTDLQSQFQKSKYSSKLSNYYDQAASHPYGVKVHQFYKDFAKDVKSVHEEAKRISEIQKKEAATSTAPTTTAASGATIADEKPKPAASS